MKSTTETYFVSNSHAITSRLSKRLENFKSDYDNKRFGLRFFLDVQVPNVREDLIYFRNLLITHIAICKKNGINEDSSAITNAQYYIDGLNDAESKSFIHILRIKEPWFGLSEKVKEQNNKRLIEILNEVL